MMEDINMKDIYEKPFISLVKFEETNPIVASTEDCNDDEAWTRSGKQCSERLVGYFNEGVWPPHL